MPTSPATGSPQRDGAAAGTVSLDPFSGTRGKPRTFGWNHHRIMFGGAILGVSIPAAYHAAVDARLMRGSFLIAVLVGLVATAWIIFEYRRRDPSRDADRPDRRRRRAGVMRGAASMFRAFGFVGIGIWALTQYRILIATSLLSFAASWAARSMARHDRELSEITWTRPRRIALTRFGLLSGLLCAALGIVALQTGVNLIIALFGVMSALITVGYVLAGLNFGRLGIRRRVPDEIVAGAPTIVTAELVNRRRRLPAFSIWVQEGWPDGVELPPVLPHAYALRIAPAASTEIRYSVTFPRRGIFPFVGFTLMSRFPFSLLTRYRHVREPQEVLVLPRPVPVPPGLTPALDSSGADVWHAAPLGRGDGDVRGLREYVVGRDPIKLIHWPTTARAQTPVVREQERLVAGPLWVALLRGPAGEDFERAVELAAALVRRAGARGLPVALLIPGHATLIPPARTPDRRRAALEALARIAGAPDDDGDGEEARVASAIGGLRESLSAGRRVGRGRDGAAVLIVPSGAPEAGARLLGELLAERLGAVRRVTP
jgi:uncharacterized protein (DUF58 family)